MNKKYKKTAAVFTAAILMTANLTACSLKKNKKSDLKDFSIGYLPSTGHLLYFVAKEEGFFEKEGLNANLQLFDSNNNMLSSLESGKLDAGALGSTEVVSYIQQGYDLTQIGGIMTEGHALLVKPEVVEGVDPEDYSLELLRGKRISVVPLGTQDIVWRIGLREAGLEVGKDVEFVDVESGTAAFASLNNADIDGALVFTPFRAQGVNDGYVILNYSGQIEGFEKHPCCRNIAETEKIKDDPDTYKSYLKALIQAYKFYQENQDETVDDIVKYVSVDPDIIRQETYGQYISSYPDPDKKTIVEWKDHMVDLGYFDDFDIGSHVNVDIYKKALDEVIAENPDDKDFYANMVTHYEQFNS
ncbi:MAG: ABC transporter substrate-binding protein [Ruminococcus sp.]|nr:ABC transporter substrate-binding protein [Ruminococcus sp.]